MNDKGTTHEKQAELRFTYEDQEYGRLDKAILERISGESELSGLTRSQLKRHIEAGAAEINDTVVSKAGAVLKPGYEVSFTPVSDFHTDLEEFNFPLEILHEDSELLVINKPAGITVHPGAGRKTGTLIQAVLYHLRTTQAEDISGAFRGSERPGIVHRLDADTTGLLVIAKNVRAHNFLSQQFAERTVEREYRALVLSTPRKKRLIDSSDSGVIDQPLDRSVAHRTQMAIVESGGKRAVTHWEVLERYGWANLLKVKLETGRTHQIRVHLTSVDSPILGDRVYGNFDALPKDLHTEANRFGRQALHAAVLGFVHPKTKEFLRWEVDVPEDFQELIELFRSSS